MGNVFTGVVFDKLACKESLRKSLCNGKLEIWVPGDYKFEHTRTKNGRGLVSSQREVYY